jgi:hypothetical protein
MIMKTEFRAIVRGASNRLATEYGLISRTEPLLAPQNITVATCASSPCRSSMHRRLQVV